MTFTVNAYALFTAASALLLAGIIFRGIKKERKMRNKTYRNIRHFLPPGGSRAMAVVGKDSIPVWEIIKAAGTKPFGFMKFTPGPGLGGHCIPIDPHYLSWKLKTINQSAKFIALAEEINSHMPHYVVCLITEALNSLAHSVKEADILIIGVAYKPNIDDVRESPALDIIEILEEKGAKVSYYDPLVSQIKVGDRVFESVSEPDTMGYDCSVIVTPHDIMLENDDLMKFLNVSATIVDTRNITKKLNIRCLPDFTHRPIISL